MRDSFGKGAEGRLGQVDVRICGREVERRVFFGKTMLSIWTCLAVVPIVIYMGSPKSRVVKSTLGTLTPFGFLYILKPFWLMKVVTADMVVVEGVHGGC